MSFDIGGFFNNAMSGLNNSSNALQSELKALQAKEGGATPEDMVGIQFKLGQYNAMMEMVSSVSKSMTDLLKNLAQRTG